eukprot:CAMPEP_0115689668 /NCGR_PEP_ID=MMETSP0272-20121206/61686_1 /TAXON_ID=71861 /ORGANISM="Scrippsiella trochoidea, Strain CCMP3099" /LENGTH=301 /DNA_ID=CAMNT_0003129477 /DNA_START=87 /DNA_END=989 /DNA_ORIENTATION=+
MSRTASGKLRKSWRAIHEVDTSRQAVFPLHMDINLDKFAESQQEANSRNIVKKVGQERVDDPTAEFDNMNFARAVGSDLAQIYKAYPGDSQLIRLRKPMSPGSYTAEREAWMQAFAVNQGERMKALLVELGVPETSIKVSVEFAGPNAPAGMFYLVVPSQSFAENKKAKEAQCVEETKAIMATRNVKFDFDSGRCFCVKEIKWKSRVCGPKLMEPPIAELAEPEDAKRVFRDMVAIWQVWQVPACLYADVNDMGTGDPCIEGWFQQLGRNRAMFVQRELEDLGIPRGQLEAMISGDRKDRP